MKTQKIFSFVLLFIAYNSFSQDLWEIRDTVNGSPKAVCGSFVSNGHGYIVGGLDEFGFKRKMYSYNPIQNDWDNEGAIGGPNGDGLDRGSASSFAIGNKGYVCLGQGQTNPYFRDLWEYDVVTGVWSQKADFLGSARRQAVSFTINNIAYVGTGQDATGLKKDFYKYDPTSNTWTQLNDFLGTARRQAVGFSMGNEGYIGTGDDGVLKNDFFMYNTFTDSWIQKANFPGTPRAGATGWGIFPTGFIATGEDITSTYMKDVWEYNYYGNVWIQRNDFLGAGRKNATSFVIDGVAYLGTGYNGVFLDDFYAYYGIVGVKELTSNFESVSYPNPATTAVTLTFNDENSQDLLLKIYSISGADVTKSVQINYSLHSLSINTEALQNGNYIYSLSNSINGKQSTGKLMIL